MDIDISYAETDQDVIAIHRFLCVVSHPVLYCDIDPVESITEVDRVRKEGAAIMAKIDGELVGSLGLIKVKWWYGNARDPKAFFLTDRWFFDIPTLHHRGVGTALKAEGAAVALSLTIPLIINGKMRRFDRSGVMFSKPEVHPAEICEGD